MTQPIEIESRGLTLPPALHLLELGARFVRYEQDDDHTGGAFLELAYYCPTGPGLPRPEWDDVAFSEEVDNITEAREVLAELTEEDVA